MRILLIKLNHIGDVLMLTPTLRFLREEYPAAEIDVLIRRGTESVLIGNKDITNLFLTGALRGDQTTCKDSFFDALKVAGNLFFKRYDYAFDLSNSDRAKFCIQLTCSKIVAANNAYGELGWKAWIFNRKSEYQWGLDHQVLKDFNTVTGVMGISGEPGPLRIDTEKAKNGVESWLERKICTKEFAVIHTVSRWPFKQWVQNRWIEVANYLSEKMGLSTVFSCGPVTREIQQAGELADASRSYSVTTEGKLSLIELGSIVARARLFIGVDTVAMHIAAAVQTPVVALFGPSSEWSWRPWRCQHELVLGQCSCKRTRNFVCDKTRPFPCMEGIQVSNVLDAINSISPPTKRVK